MWYQFCLRMSSGRTTVSVHCESTTVSLWNENLGQETQHPFNEEFLCWWMRLSKQSYIWVLTKERTSMKPVPSYYSFCMYLWVAMETMIDYWSWIHWLKSSALASGWNEDCQCKNNRSVHIQFLLQKRLSILLKIATKKKKKKKVFLENKDRQSLCVKIFFLFFKGISSSKGNTKGLYKFIFHITID